VGPFESLEFRVSLWGESMSFCDVESGPVASVFNSASEQNLGFVTIWSNCRC
jgi:hypothetical protein